MRSLKQNFRHLYLIVFISFLTMSISVAEELTPERYINLEIAVRSITLEEVRGRATGNETGVNYKQLVKEQYLQYGVSPGSHLKYGNKNQKGISKWLQKNPNKQAVLNKLTIEFEQLINASE